MILSVVMILSLGGGNMTIFDFKDGYGWVPAHKHSNGGALVSS